MAVTVKPSCQLTSIRDRCSPVHEREKVDVPLGNDLSELYPAHTPCARLSGCSAILRLHGQLDVSLLVFVEPFRTLGTVNQDKRDQSANDNSGEALYGYQLLSSFLAYTNRVPPTDKKDPSPSGESSETVHLGDSKRQQSRKGTSCRARGIEQGDASLQHVSRVPVACHKNRSREEARLWDA